MSGFGKGRSLVRRVSSNLGLTQHRTAAHQGSRRQQHEWPYLVVEPIFLFVNAYALQRAMLSIVVHTLHPSIDDHQIAGHSTHDYFYIPDRMSPGETIRVSLMAVKAALFRTDHPHY